MPASLDLATHTTLRYVCYLVAAVTLINPCYGDALFSKPDLAGEPKLISEPEFLDVTDAFQLQSSMHEGLLTLSWRIAPNYFLYHHSLKVETKRAGQLVDISSQFRESAALRKSDPYFGQVGVYYHHADLTQKPASESETKNFAADEELHISYQGCAESGLCYPTQTEQIIVNN